MFHKIIPLWIKYQNDLYGAFGLLSRIPCPQPKTFPPAPKVWAWPYVGGMIGLLACIGGKIGLGVGLSPAIAALIILAILITTTGAMHEDGLADSCDGLWGGWDKQRRLDIMKDSHIGSYGVIALIIIMLARYHLISQMLNLHQIMPLIAACALSRCCMACLMAWLPHARKNGLSKSVGRPSRASAISCGAITTALLAYPCGLAILPAAIAAGLATLIIAIIALHKIGGQTGDILGATQIMCEITISAVLLTPIT